MKTHDLIHAIAHRKLERLKRFQEIRHDSESAVTLLRDLRLDDTEGFIGAYENTPAGDSSLVFTDAAIYVRRSTSWEKIPYSRIGHVDIEPAPNVSAISVTLVDSTTTTIPVCGGDDDRGSRDAASVFQFLLRVVEAMKDRPVQE